MGGGTKPYAYWKMFYRDDVSRVSRFRISVEHQGSQATILIESVSQASTPNENQVLESSSRAVRERVAPAPIVQVPDRPIELTATQKAEIEAAGKAAFDRIMGKSAVQPSAAQPAPAPAPVSTVVPVRVNVGLQDAGKNLNAFLTAHQTEIEGALNRGARSDEPRKALADFQIATVRGGDGTTVPGTYSPRLIFISEQPADFQRSREERSQGIHPKLLKGNSVTLNLRPRSGNARSEARLVSTAASSESRKQIANEVSLETKVRLFFVPSKDGKTVPTWASKKRSSGIPFFALYTGAPRQVDRNDAGQGKNVYFTLLSLEQYESAERITQSGRLSSNSGGHLYENVPEQLGTLILHLSPDDLLLGWDVKPDKLNSDYIAAVRAAGSDQVTVDAVKAAWKQTLSVAAGEQWAERMKGKKIILSGSPIVLPGREAKAKNTFQPGEESPRLAGLRLSPPATPGVEFSGLESGTFLDTKPLQEPRTVPEARSEARAPKEVPLDRTILISSEPQQGRARKQRAPGNPFFVVYTGAPLQVEPSNAAKGKYVYFSVLAPDQLLEAQKGNRPEQLATVTLLLSPKDVLLDWTVKKHTEENKETGEKEEVKISDPLWQDLFAAASDHWAKPMKGKKILLDPSPVVFPKYVPKPKNPAQSGEKPQARSESREEITGAAIVQEIIDILESPQRLLSEREKAALVTLKNMLRKKHPVNLDQIIRRDEMLRTFKSWFKNQLKGPSFVAIIFFDAANDNLRVKTLSPSSLPAAMIPASSISASQAGMSARSEMRAEPVTTPGVEFRGPETSHRVWESGLIRYEAGRSWTMEEVLKENMKFGGSGEKGFRAVTEKITDGVWSLAAHALNAVEVTASIFGIPTALASKKPDVTAQPKTVREKARAAAARKALGIKATTASDGVVLGAKLAFEDKALLAKGWLFGDAPVVILGDEASLSPDDLALLRQVNARLEAVGLPKIRMANTVDEAEALLNEDLKKVAERRKTTGVLSLNLKAMANWSEPSAVALKQQLGDNAILVTSKRFRIVLDLAGIATMVDRMRTEYLATAKSA